MVCGYIYVPSCLSVRVDKLSPLRFLILGLLPLALIARRLAISSRIVQMFRLLKSLYLSLLCSTVVTKDASIPQQSPSSASPSSDMEDVAQVPPTQTMDPSVSQASAHSPAVLASTSSSEVQADSSKVLPPPLRPGLPVVESCRSPFEDIEMTSFILDSIKSPISSSLEIQVSPLHVGKPPTRKKLIVRQIVDESIQHWLPMVVHNSVEEAKFIIGLPDESSPAQISHLTTLQPKYPIGSLSPYNHLRDFSHVLS
ncbi:unnamed protein product [Cochlearia groenlandica]